MVFANLKQLRQHKKKILKKIDFKAKWLVSIHFIYSQIKDDNLKYFRIYTQNKKKS